jgi:hypothetical protein
MLNKVAMEGPPLGRYYQPYRILLDSGAQPSMLGKVAMEGLTLTNANLEPWQYQILTSMGESKIVQKITKHEVVIQVNHVKPTYYTKSMQKQWLHKLHCMMF